MELRRQLTIRKSPPASGEPHLRHPHCSQGSATGPQAYLGLGVILWGLGLRGFLVGFSGFAEGRVPFKQNFGERP